MIFVFLLCLLLINQTLLRSNFINSSFVSHHGFQTLEYNKSTRPLSSVSSCLETLMKQKARGYETYFLKFCFKRVSMKAISNHISPSFLHYIRLCVVIKIDIDLVFCFSPECDRNSSELFIVKSSTNFNCSSTSNLLTIFYKGF